MVGILRLRSIACRACCFAQDDNSLNLFLRDPVCYENVRFMGLLAVAV